LRVARSNHAVQIAGWSQDNAHSEKEDILMKFSRLITTTLTAALLAGYAGAQSEKIAQSTPAHGNIAETAEWERVKEALKHARPVRMPMPIPGKEAPSGAAAAITESGGMVRFEARTGSLKALPQVQHLNPAGPPKERLPLLPKAQQGSQIKSPSSPWKDGAGALTSAANVFSPDAATAPSPLTTPYGFPFNSVGRLLGRWNVNGIDYYWLCSLSMTSDYWAVSAGHCVYNHDPTDDGSGTGAGFANEMWAWMAETDVVDPVDPDNWPDFPYGVAKMTYEITYNAWINSSDLNWDFSFIQLDRRIGDHTGWMGREWGRTATSLNFDGYPAESPYVPSNNPYQYPGFDANNVSYYTCCRIGMSAFTYGGHSGGPVWRFDGTNRYLEGVNSTSNRAGSAEATLLTSQIETDLENAIANGTAPVDRPQVIEYVFNGSSKGLGQTSTPVGSSFPMTINAFNAGYADAGVTSADIYLTSNPNNITGGHYIGTHSFGSLGAYTFSVQNTSISIPVTTPPGTYYVGYVLNSANAQYNTDKNSVVITNQLMTAYCNPDAFEPDGTPGQASTLTSGSTQAHTICAQADQDWMKFTVSASTAATLQTSGPSGDTTLTLYNSSLNQIDFNDDSGGTAFSTINRACSTNPLPAGTYYVRVQSFNSATIIPSYSVSLHTSVCPSATSTKLFSSLNPAGYGQAVTFTAAVSSTHPGTISGTVQFLDGASVIGSAPLSAGKASFTTAALAGGSHAMTANYIGSASYSSSASAPLSQKVNKAATTSTLTAAPNPGSYGQAIKLTATVKSGTLKGVGTVTFKRGGANLGTATLNASGVATLSVTTLPVGTDSLTAVYPGNINFLPSSSAVASEVINKAKTTVTLVSSSNPSTHGTAVTFTVTIKPAFGGSPTGTVTFKDGASVLGAGTVNATTHQAKLTTSKLAVGTHNVSAAYAGSPNFSAGTSAVLKQVVQ